MICESVPYRPDPITASFCKANVFKFCEFHRLGNVIQKNKMSRGIIFYVEVEALT